jgi:hypothetical protein
MTQTLAPKQTPVQKRIDFIAEVTKPVNDRALAMLAAKSIGQDIPDLTLDEFRDIAKRMSAEGPAFGKTARWKNACGYAIIEICDAEEKGTLDRSTARWAVVQCSVWMAHAAD